MRVAVTFLECFEFGLHLALCSEQAEDVYEDGSQYDQIGCKQVSKILFQLFLRGGWSRKVQSSL
jgi:hypothetical protein